MIPMVKLYFKSNSIFFCQTGLCGQDNPKLQRQIMKVMLTRSTIFVKVGHRDPRRSTKTKLQRQIMKVMSTRSIIFAKVSLQGHSWSRQS